MPTLQLTIGASADDASEVATVVSITATPLANCDTAGVWNGFIFRGVNIPAGATILSASLGIVFTSASLDEPDVTIYGLDVATPAAFTTGASDISSRARTTASVDWSNTNAGTSRVQTADISAIIQELVNSYAPYSNGVIGFVWTTRAGSSTRDTSAQSYDGSTTNCAQLNLVYSPNLINVSEPIGVAEGIPTVEVQAAEGGTLTIQDIPQAIGVTEAVTVEIIRLVNVTQAIGVSENVGGFYSEGIAVSEVVQVAITTSDLTINNIPQNIGVAESATVSPPLCEINVSESIGVADTALVNATGDLIINLSESIGVSESIGQEVSAPQINVSQAIGVAESRTVTTGQWTLIDVGDGYSDGTPKQIVRLSDGTIYIVSRAFTNYPDGPKSPLRVYKANSATIPTAFSEMDAANHPLDVSTWGVAVDGNDDLHIVWSHRSTWDSGNGDGITDVVYYALFDTGTDTWGTPVTLEGTLATWEIGQGDEQVCVTLDASGYPHVVYLKGEVPRIVRYTFWNGSTWSTPETLATYAGTSCWHPGLRFDRAGRMILTYMVHDWNGSSTARFYVRVYDGSWGSPVDVTGADLYGGIDDTTALYVTADNRYHIAFLSVTDKYIRYYYSDDLGATWTANNPGSGTEIGDDPQVAPGTNGTKVRIYAHNSDATPGMSYFEGDGGSGTWGSRQTIIDNDTPFDCTANPRWSRYFYNHPEYLDVIFWDSTYGGAGNELWLAIEQTEILPQINVSQSIGVVESVTLEVGSPQVSVSQSIGVTESPTVSLDNYVVGVSQPITVVESVSAELVTEINVSQGIGVAETVGVVTSDPQIGVSESTSVSESVNVTAGGLPNLQPNVSDNVGVAESATAEVSAPQVSVSQPIGVAESDSEEISTEINVSQSLGVSESIGTEISTPISVSDLVGVTEAVLISISDLQITITEPISVNESINVSAGGLPDLIPNVSETISLSESVVVTTSAPLIGVTDNISVTENAGVSVATLGALTISVAENILVNESTNEVISASQINVSESVSLAESLFASVGITVSVSQPIGVSESGSLQTGSPQISVSESISLSESASLLIPNLFLLVSEAVSVAESTVVYILYDRLVNVSESVIISESASVVLPVGSVGEDGLFRGMFRRMWL